MKKANFLWAWNDRAPQRDTMMTRARACGAATAVLAPVVPSAR